MKTFTKTLLAVAVSTLMACGGGGSSGDSNRAPSVRFTSDCAGMSCTVTNTSVDVDGSIASVSWSWDGQTSTDNSITIDFDTFESKPVTLTVTDNEGATNTLTKDVTLVELSAADIHANFKLVYNEVNSLVLSSYQEAQVVSQIIDLDGDSDSDFFIGVGEQWDENYLAGNLPGFIIKNNGNGYFTYEQRDDLAVYFRFSDVADFNNDGLDDLILVADHRRHTVDGVDYREDRPHLFLQTSDGSLVDASDQVEEIWADWHGLEAVDFDLDGDMDFIAAGLHKKDIVFFENNNATFTISKINTSGVGITSIESADLDNDGYPELVLGLMEYSPTVQSGYMIFRNDAGVFTYDTSDLYLYDVNVGTSYPAVETKEIDVNLDACTDIVMYHTKYENNQPNYYYVFEGDCNGNLTFSSRIESNDHYRWLPNIDIVDLDNDGYQDIVGYRKDEGRLVGQVMRNTTFNTFEKVDPTEYAEYLDNKFLRY